MSRYYIDKLGIKYEDTPQGWNKGDSREEFWAEERSEYGFDERETWSLYYTVNLMLYERLCRYKDIAINCINLEYHKFTYKGVELTQLECLNRMIEGLKLDLTLDDYDEKRKDPKIKELIDDVYPIYGLCKNALWW